MLSVVKPEDIKKIVNNNFRPNCGPEIVSPAEALGRVLAEDIKSEEYVPGFERSTVDGYALSAADTFGCSDPLPALLNLSGEILMGETGGAVRRGECAYIPTGGALPSGADAVQMLEYAEDYGDGSIGILRPAAPGENVIHKGDDAVPGMVVLPRGRRLGPQDIGALAAMGISSVPVCERPAVGIISTGDELVGIDQKPAAGRIRDVNSSLLAALAAQMGAEAHSYGIVRDGEKLLEKAVCRALKNSSAVLISGGSSVGAMDSTCRVIEKLGHVIFHGIAMKPGKPTILGAIDGRPVVGLPGHPVAAFFVSQVLVREIINRLMGRSRDFYRLRARLSEPLSANHGRAQYTGVFLREGPDGPEAVPIHTKSGLISSLARSDGFICIPRDCEGMAAGETVEVMLFSNESEAKNEF